MTVEEAFGFRIEPGSGVPVFLQFVQQVRQAVLLGYLREGDRLPAVKDAAAAAVVNPNTVVKAYRQLELEGLVTPRPGSGTYVNSPAAAPVAPRDLAAAQRALRRFFTAAEQAGLDEQAVVAMFEIERRARGGREAVA
jgi:GntR family transcriptional regulator